MNPQGSPAEAVPLQGRGEGFPGQYGQPGYPGQPGCTGPSTVVQYTTVNLISEPPKDHVVWSLCSFLYCNTFCLGLAAFIYSIKARDRKVAGDLEGARHYASTARCLNIWATVLASIGMLILLIVIIVNAVFLIQAFNSVMSRDSRFNYPWRG